MYKIINRLHLVECECCGDAVLVDDKTLLDMFIDGNISTEEPIDMCEECDGDCDNCTC